MSRVDRGHGCGIRIALRLSSNVPRSGGLIRCDDSPSDPPTAYLICIRYETAIAAYASTRGAYGTSGTLEKAW